MAGPERIFVGLGANLGAAARCVTEAIEELGAIPQTRLVAASSLYRSAPVDAVGPDFVNAVAELRSELEPHALLAALMAIETRHGRQRPYPGAPRRLDLDLLFYGERRSDDAVLSLPHPRAHERAFVLAPLAELAPGWPCRDGRSAAELLAALGDQRVERIERCAGI